MTNINGILQTKIKSSNVYEFPKPPGTVQAHCVVLFGKCFASFNTGTDIVTREVCKTEKVRADRIKETDTHLIIEI
jgi:hypothetical protein